MRTQHVAIGALTLLVSLGAASTAGAAPAPTPDPTTSPKPAPSPTPTPTPTEPVVLPVSARFTLDPSDRYGVGQLVTVKFSRDIVDRAAAERGLSVHSDDDVPPGSWAWMDDHTVVYRPRTFWPGDAQIDFTVDLAGVQLGKTAEGTLVGSRGADRVHQLQTARSFIMRIKDSKHRLFVEVDGKPVKSFPVSLGKPGWETYSGTKILTGEKYVKLRMVGNFPNRNATWDVIAPYSIRLTPNGEFIHGAPWAKNRMGKWNGSHGCTNMFIRDAKWLYQRVRAGDPVVTTGTGRPMPKTLGVPGAYWNYPWKTWREFSALYEPPAPEGGKGDGDRNPGKPGKDPEGVQAQTLPAPAPLQGVPPAGP